MARSAHDCALLLQAMAGHDPADPASATAPVDDYTARIDAGVAGLRVGVPRRYFYDELEPEMAAAMETALDVFRSLGAAVRDVEIPSIEAAPAGSVILFAEAFAYHEDTLRRTPELFGRSARLPISAGGLFTAGEYVQAQRIRERLRAELLAVLTEVDLLVTPVSPGPATTFEATYSAPRPRISRTMPFNLAGLPALALPCGFTEAGLPLGMQIAGAPFAEALVLRAGHAYQGATDWHTRRPPVE
jgi:aspartyl-tRNA(Asn)/glutamyl-tRNA(Gln) amidotransferase subunit A